MEGDNKRNVKAIERQREQESPSLASKPICFKHKSKQFLEELDVKVREE